MEFFEEPEDHEESIHAVNRFELMVKNSEQYYFDCEEFHNIVEHYLLKADYDKAFEVVNYALDLHPTNFDLKLFKAQVLSGKVQYKKALVLLEEVELVQPDNADLLIIKGSVLGKLRMSERAIACYLKALPSSEFKDEVYCYIANEHQHNLDYEMAIKYFKLALTENPENESAIFDLNMCFECTTAFQDAINFYSKLTDEAPYSESLWFNLAGAYSKVEQWEKAIDCYDFAIAISPEFSSAYFNKANVLASKGDYEGAIKVYQETFDYESPNFITYTYIGECYERMEDFEKGIEFYKKSLTNNETYSPAWLGVAICLDGLKRPNEAYAAITRALELDEEDPDLWYTAAEIEEKLGYVEDALISMRKAVNLDVTDVTLFLDYLQMLDRHFEPGIVSDGLEEAAERFNSNTQVLYFKSAHLLKQGKYQQAYQCFELALNGDFKGHKKVFDYYPDAKNNQNILELIDLYRD